MIDNWPQFVEPWWSEQITRLSYIWYRRGTLPDNFLQRRGEDGYDLFGNWGMTRPDYPTYDRDLAYVRHMCGEPVDPEWGGLVDHGNPPGWEPTDLPVSYTTLRCWYTIVEGFTRVGCLNPKSVVTWGGGYGGQSLALQAFASPTEYVIDLPEMCAIQHQFLGHNLGWDRVHLCDHDGDVHQGRVNLVPLRYADSVPQGHDVFFAYFSLDESTEAAQDYVVSRDWFGADHLLINASEGIVLFDGTDHWGEIAAGLRAEGRIPS